VDLTSERDRPPGVDDSLEVLPFDAVAAAGVGRVCAGLESKGSQSVLGRLDLSPCALFQPDPGYE
jgi:hypothetical protein